MIQLDCLNEHGLHFIAMALDDLVGLNANPDGGNGLYCGKCWLTPETCYWLYKLLTSPDCMTYASPRTLELLKNGTNHPEML